MKKIPNLDKIRHGNRLFYNPSKSEKTELTEIKKELENKYGVSLENRDNIIKQLIATLTHGNYKDFSINGNEESKQSLKNQKTIELLVIRSDIKNFYPSINKHILYRKLMKANILSASTMETLKPMFFSKAVTGVPLGLPFSSVLAEIYLEDFDREIKTAFNPTFYFRYVDDILIINYASNLNISNGSEKELLEKVFQNNSLQINEDKTEIINFPVNVKKFDYLGYEFEADKSRLLIRIKEEKYKKILNNVKIHFYLFKKSNRSRMQFWILYYKLLNSIYGVVSRENNKRKIFFGLGFSYRFINDENQILEMIKIIKGQIFSSKLSSYERETLLHIIKYKSSPLELLQKRYDYTSLTNNQIRKIKKRLCIDSDSENISRIFFKLYK